MIVVMEWECGLFGCILEVRRIQVLQSLDLQNRRHQGCHQMDLIQECILKVATTKGKIMMTMMEAEDIQNKRVSGDKKGPLQKIIRLFPMNHRQGTLDGEAEAEEVVVMVEDGILVIGK
jgi:hypothetical protein